MAKLKSKGKKRYDPDEDTLRPKLDEEKKREMLAILIRNKTAFELVADQLKPSHLEHMGPSYVLVWRLVSKFHRRHDEMPGRATLTADLHNEIDANDSLVPEELTRLDEFLEYAYDDREHGKGVTKATGTHCRIAVATCRQLLEESIADSLSEELVKEGRVPVDVPELLRQHQDKLDAVSAMDAIQVDVPFPDGWDSRKEVQLVTTGVPALDDFTGGGLRGGEMILFMGPYGSCKTTLVCHGVAQQVIAAAELTATDQVKKDKKGRPMTPVVVLVFTESDKDEYRVRLMSHLARVKWRRLRQMSKIADLSAAEEAGKKKDTKYELKEFKEEIKNDQPFESEQTRVRNAQTLFNKHLVLIDCTDSDDSPNRIGRGGVPEIANVIRSVFRRRKDCYPIFLWIDHLSALADRVAEADASIDEKLHLILKRMPRQITDKICKPWNIPAVLIHQFSGQANKRKSVARFHHADAAGSTSIAEYVNFAAVAGPVDENGMCKWECTKHRREPASPLKVVQVQGQFNRLRDMTNRYTVDYAGGRIVSKKEARAVALSARARATANGLPAEMSAFGGEDD